MGDVALKTRASIVREAAPLLQVNDRATFLRTRGAWATAIHTRLNWEQGFWFIGSLCENFFDTVVANLCPACLEPLFTEGMPL